MTLADKVAEMILSALESMEVTSANPTHVNRLIQVNHLEKPDLNEELKKQTKDEETNLVGDSKKPKTKNKEKSTFDRIPEKVETKGKANFIRDQVNPNSVGNFAKGAAGGGLGLLQGGIGRVGAFGASAFPPAMIALLVLQLAPVIVKSLQQPGGPFDKRFKVDMRKEMAAELDRQTRQNTRIGDRQVIIQQFEGFRNYDGFASTNTGNLINKNANRVLDIGLFDRAEMGVDG